MMKKYVYRFDEDTGILYKYHFGGITLNDIYTSWQYAFEKKLITKEVKGFILDYRNAYFDFPYSQYEKIAEFYQANLQIFGNYKFAILTENPKDIVIPVLVESRDKGYKSKPFSTEKAAIEWILSNG